MDYVFQFGTVWQDWPLLLHGLWATIRLSALAMVLGLAIGVAGAWGDTEGPPALQWPIRAYVELIRNTPFLVQLLVIYLGLPEIGVRFDPDAAALVALTVNLGAYAIEIVRAGIEAVPEGQTEAGLALGLHPFQVFCLIVIRPALRAVYPALASQFILLMLGTSIVSVIGAEELTAAANSIQARTFRAFEIYFTVLALYLALSLAFRVAFAAAGRLILARVP
ncbi:MAG: amino acid ABC transporter permease [Acidisphaera sp.]|nr:amino acid ABC transporter permease [Acidisphaera sp.]